MKKISEIIKRCYNWFIVPKVGKRYNFFDDGKIYPNRVYIAECIKVIKFNDAKDIIFNISPNDILYPYSENHGVLSMSLYDAWLENVQDCGWLFKETTDYFVCCRIENYDDNDIWFVRTKDNRWFSIDIQNNWQSGLLDVSNEFEKIIK